MDKRTCVIIVLLILPNLVAGQYDFDSLYLHSMEFRTMVNNVFDSDDFFADSARVEVGIQSDFHFLIKNKFEGEYQEALVTYQFSDSVLLRRKIKIRARGNMRKKVCYFPPLTLNFPKNDSTLVYFRQYDKIKFVASCRKGETYDQYVISEYLAYRILNQLTDISFRVRLLKVNYLDISGKLKPWSGYGFLIESTDQVKQRLNAIELEVPNVKDQQIQSENYLMVSLFNYMIGNTDWSVPALHNVKMFRYDDYDQPDPFIIPYDFDYSGMVNTIYAVPNEKLPIKSVQERYYLGPCRPMDQFTPILNYYTENKPRIYAVYQDCPYITEKNLKNSLDYLDSFFEIISSPKLVQSTILSTCY